MGLIYMYISLGTDFLWMTHKTLNFKLALISHWQNKNSDYVINFWYHHDLKERVFCLSKRLEGHRKEQFLMISIFFLNIVFENPSLDSFLTLRPVSNNVPHWLSDARETEIFTGLCEVWHLWHSILPYRFHILISVSVGVIV